MRYELRMIDEDMIGFVDTSQMLRRDMTPDEVVALLNTLDEIVTAARSNNTFELLVAVTYAVKLTDGKPA